MIGHRADNVGEADVVVDLERRVAATTPKSRAALAAPHPGRAARRDARRADALPLRDRGRRHARQDHDHEPDVVDPRRGRRGSDLRHRRPAEERGHQCAPRRRQLPRGRSRRERRLVPAPAADDRDRHQHRQRSPRHARRRLRAAQAELRRVPAQPAVLRARGAVRGRRARPQHPAEGRIARWSATASRRGADLRAENLRRDGLRTHFDVVRRADGLRLAGHGEPAGHCTTCSTRWPRSPSRSRSASRTKPSSARSPNFQGIDRRLSTSATSDSPDGGDAVTLVDDYGHHPTEIAATLDAIRQGYAGPPPGARVPAASLHAHARPARRFRHACCPAATRCW